MRDTNKNVSISITVHLQKRNLLSRKKQPICGAKNPTNTSIDYCINSINSTIFVKLFFAESSSILWCIMGCWLQFTCGWWWWQWWWGVWLSSGGGGGGGGGVGYRIEVSKNEGELRKCQVYGRWALLSKREWGGVVWTYFTGKWHDICQVTARKYCAFRLMVSNRGVLKSNYSVE